MNPKKLITAALLPAMLIASAIGLSACSPAAASAPVTIGEDTIILDVRTPEEFATGHLEGARLLDFNSGELAAAIPNLDPDAEYVVYCRSGNRSGQAIALMEQAGINGTTNLGSVEDASTTTGIEIVTN
ncbi:MAG: rhodanese-like domain-containing protein [Leucobacter sp.]